MTQTFKDRVYIITKRIPMGMVLTYGQIAELAGSPGAARAVGMCMKTNTSPHIVPCHRVVASDGSLTGYAFGGVSEKKKTLQKEGVMFLGDKVDLSVSQWHPKKGKGAHVG